MDEEIADCGQGLVKMHRAHYNIDLKHNTVTNFMF